MIEIASAHIVSTVPPAAFFKRWADMATWPEWNLDTEWVRLDGPFVTGATGQLKPKGGPKVKFVVQSLVADREFIDVSHLWGARLSFDHQVTATDDGGSEVEVRITMAGPLSRLWNAILGKGLQSSVHADLQRLATVAERSHAA